MKTVTALILAALLTACGGGSESPDAEVGPPLCAAKPEVCK